jgi:uncharacterized protein YjbI with pentapeptide repeats
MPDNIDPFDVEALGEAVNDSASRVSTIWVSFLIFSLYLLIAASTVTHRQLFLADPVKLPVLNIDLPLWGFFFLAPILFVTFHIYVLLQVLLLAHTAAAYNAAVERAGFAAEESASLRQRLANTLFAQIFAGAPRQRDGWIGWILRAMAWTTLAIAPIMIIIVFQFAFLPYHSHLATWTHRFLVVAELGAAFVLWPLVLDAKQDFEWERIRSDCKQATALLLRLFGSKDKRREDRIWLRQKALPLTLSALFFLVSVLVATFPGEPHVSLLTGHSWTSVQCDRWLQQDFDFIDLSFDRLDLRHVDVIDHEKLEKIEEATRKGGEPPYRGERTRILRGRDFNCGDFSNYADLRRVDLTGSHLRSADFTSAKLQGASLADSQLQGASFADAELQDTNFDDAQLPGANFTNAKLQGATLANAKLAGAVLTGAELQSASLDTAQLQGASLFRAKLQGASLHNTKLQGAYLVRAALQGAFLDGAELQGATLYGAQLQGTSLDDTQLQGADFNNSSMTYSRIIGAYVWRARNADCRDAHVGVHKLAPIVAAISNGSAGYRFVQATPEEITKFIEQSVSAIPDKLRADSARQRMRVGLALNRANDDSAAIEQVWRNCEDAPSEPSWQEFERKHAEYLRNLVCENSEDGAIIAKGIIRIWILHFDIYPYLSKQLALGLLSEDGRNCGTTAQLDERDKKILRFIGAVTTTQTPPDSAPAPAGVRQN